MQHLESSKNWNLIKATLGLAIVFLLLGPPQRSLAINGAIIVKHNITFLTDGSFVDSDIDPSNPEAPGDDGDVISTDGTPGVISIGNGNIYGTVVTGPGGTVSVGPDGGIGTHAWLSTNSGVEPGYVSDTGNFGFPTVTLPYTNGPGLPSGGTYVVKVGTNILSVTNSSAPPPLPATNQVLVCITNTYYLTNSSYPGPMPGLVTNFLLTVASSNAILVTNCSSTEVKAGPNPPPPEDCCPGTAPSQIHGEWFYYPITGILTNVTYTFSTNSIFIWEQTNYNYQILQAPLYATNYYDHIVCGNYCAATLTGVTLVTCPSILVLTNGLDLTGTNSLTILPGESLSLYVDGGNVTIAGNGITNSSGVDAFLQISCTPGVSSLFLNATAPLSALIVAPDTDIRINGSGSVPVEYSGVIMANSLVANGVLHLHGDGSLALRTAPVITANVSPRSLLLQTNVTAVVGWQVTFDSHNPYAGTSFQWFFNGTNLIANATNYYLSLSNLTTDMAGEYTLQVSSPGQFMVSNPAQLTVVTTPAATLDSFSLSASNQFQFNVNGLPGYNYSVEGSTNLTIWTPLLTNLCPFTFTDTNQLGPQYFYRAVYLPTP